MFKKAFTLAEILIVMGLIGIVAETTIPTLIKDFQAQVTKVDLKRTYTILNNALLGAIGDNGNTNIACYYHKTFPYGAAKCNTYGTDGDCTQWTFLDGSPLPSDYLGYFSECENLLPAIFKKMKISKVCAPGRAIIDGCIPSYKASDQVYLDVNSGKTQFDATKATSGCVGWRTATFNTKEAVVLVDGTILIPYSSLFSQSPIIGIDINGMKAPNRAGYDLFFFMTEGSDTEGMKYYPGGCDYMEPGGTTSAAILSK